MFAKLFDTPHGQLLAFMDTEDDEPVVVLKGEPRNGVLPSVTLSGYSDEEVGQKREFEAIDQAKADSTAKSMHDAMASLFGEPA